MSEDSEEDPEAEKEQKVVGKYCIMRVDIPMPPRPKKLKLHSPVINLTGTDLENTIIHYMSRSFDNLYTVKGFRFGICLPSSCAAHEIQAILNKGL